MKYLLLTLLLMVSMIGIANAQSCDDTRLVYHQSATTLYNHLVQPTNFTFLQTPWTDINGVTLTQCNALNAWLATIAIRGRMTGSTQLNTGTTSDGELLGNWAQLQARLLVDDTVVTMPDNPLTISAIGQNHMLLATDPTQPLPPTHLGLEISNTGVMTWTWLVQNLPAGNHAFDVEVSTTGRNTTVIGDSRGSASSDLYGSTLTLRAVDARDGGTLP